MIKKSIERKLEKIGISIFRKSKNGPVAQMEELLTTDQRVVGSNPIGVSIRIKLGDGIARVITSLALKKSRRIRIPHPPQNIVRKRKSPLLYIFYEM
jgi:hypothetical protein